MASVKHHGASTSYDAFGEPEIMPRVGNEYQAELPQLLEDSNTLPHSMAYADDEIRTDSLQNFHVGSPIQLACLSSEQSGMRESHDWPTSVDKIGKFTDKDYHLVPEICDECWSAAEKDYFLLGLYIFAKNFVEVKKFVGTKDMGALQSYYYATFHSSPEHHRWSNTRKMKHKKRTLGRGLFSGLRLQEFLSRVLPRAGECQNALLEVSKSFENTKISVVEYAFSLKAIIGLEFLVEAIGIGRGHQDLTAMATRHPKVCHHMPSENVYASLTTAEILNLLSGHHRLSKARSNDLFWEAVWPRLLASGWHSEQGTSYRHIASSSSSHSLVFLMPGVKRFSRRELVRGDQYFESVSDVLSKVAREPALLELDPGGIGCSNKAEQCGWTNDENHSSFPLLKFTVVDTSLSDGKVVEFRTFPSAAEMSRETPDEATILGKKRGRNAMAVDQEVRHIPPDASTVLLHKKRNTQDQDQDQDEVSKNLDMLPSTTTSSSTEQPRAQSLFDLNLPLDSEDRSIAADQSGHKQDIITSDNLETGSSNQTRYSTRRRPPTMRVLEAIARGYLTVNARQKRKEDEQ